MKHLSVVIKSALCDAGKNYFDWYFVCVVCIVTFLLYGKTLGYGFVYDDTYFSTRRDLNSTHALVRVFSEPFVLGSGAGGYRPIPMATLVLQILISGFHPMAFHLVNIVFYIFFILVTYLFIKQFSSSRFAAVAVSLLVLVFPTHIENVSSIKSRDDILMAIFMLTTLLVTTQLVRSQPRNRFVFFILSSVGMLVSLLCKEYAISLVLIVPAIIWLVDKGAWKKNVRIVLLPILGMYGLVIAIYSALRYNALGAYFASDSGVFYWNPLVSYGILERIYTFFKLIFLYGQKSIIPMALSFTYTVNHAPISVSFFDPGTVGGLLLLVGIIVRLVQLRNLKDSESCGYLLFLGFLLPITKLFFLGGDLFSERWMLIPSMGLLLSFFSLLKKYTKPFIYGGIFVSLFLYCLVVSSIRVTAWKGERSLGEQMIVDAPDAIQGYVLVANDALRIGQIERALEMSNKAMTIYPKHPKALFIQAVIYGQRGDWAQAVKLTQQSLAVAPNDYEAHLFYAYALMRLGEYEKSIQHLLPQMPFNQTNKRMRQILFADYTYIGNATEAAKYAEPNK